MELVIKESLRLRPPVPFMARELEEDLQIGSKESPHTQKTTEFNPKFRAFSAITSRRKPHDSGTLQFHHRSNADVS